MTVIYFILISVGIFALAIVWLRLADAWEDRRVSLCIRSIGVAKCPRCKQVMGDSAASSAKWTVIKRSCSWRSLPSRLATVICPHCAAELEFRPDGTLYSCNHKVVA